MGPMSSLSALSTKVALGRGLDAARRSGAAFISEGLTAAFRQRLAQEVSAGPFARMSTYEGRAQQEGELFHIGADLTGYPGVRQLRDELVAGIRAHGDRIPELAAWMPNEIHIQRYPTRALGITPHLDHKRYHLLIAIFTVAGSAPFTWCADRSGTAHEEWQAGPGSLVLLRAPGLAGVQDGRPLHKVGGPVSGERISVTFRMNARAP